MKKWIVLLLGVLLVLIVGPALLGWLMPDSHVASGQADYAAPPERLWSLLSDLARWPQWNSAVERMERRDDREGRPQWVAVGEWGEMPSIVEVAEPEQRLVTRIPEDAGLGFHGTWTYEIAPVADGGSRLRITERGQVDNPLLRLFVGLQDPHRTQFALMRDLGTALGQTVEPTVVDPPTSVASPRP